jgi:hypothetical protein
VYGFALLVALILMIVVVCVSIVGESGAFTYVLLQLAEVGRCCKHAFDCPETLLDPWCVRGRHILPAQCGELPLAVDGVPNSSVNSHLCLSVFGEAARIVSRVG